MEQHRKYTVRCMEGQGIDRHLLGLRLLAAQSQTDVPVFADPVFARFNDFRLSTSQIAYPWVRGPRALCGTMCAPPW